MGWPENLELAKKDSRKFIDKGEKIVKRFRDERSNSQTSSAERRYNVLWSNIKTMFPAVYSRKPKAQVERRYKDADPVGRTASQILERALQYEIDHYPDYDAALRGCVLDRLLPGRGVAWVRFDAGDQITDDVTAGEPDGDDGTPAETVTPADPMSAPSLLGLMPAPPPEKTDPADYECTPCDYVFWKDFRHSPARTWEEVTWVSRRVYMSRAELLKRFPDAKDVPLSHEPIGLDKDVTVTDDMKKAVVWEIWDKPSKKVIWRAEKYSEDLDSRDDKLKLEGFFPCPKPLFATMTTDTLQPIADFLEYQDQAQELDEITQRISMLVKAVKAVGVYDASQTGVQRLLQEGTDNTLIPVENWAGFASVGGLKGAVEMLDLQTVLKALEQLYRSREECKQVIYEITGMSDILRGATDPNETYGAQKIKSQFGSLRIKEIQQDVSRFATDLLNMKAQIMASMYRSETLVEMSGIMLTDDAQFAQQAIDLIRNESIRCYRIEIAADSMVELDEQAEKQSRVEFLGAAGAFLEKAVQAAQMAPELVPLMGEMLMFGVRSFKASRPIEAAFEQAMQKMAQPQPPKPHPEQIKMEGLMQIEQAKLQFQQQSKQADLQASMQADNAKLQASAQIEQIKAQFAAQSEQAQRAYEGQLEQARMQMQTQVDNNRQRSEAEQHALKIQNEAQLAQLKAHYDDQAHQRDMDFQRWKAELDAATRIEVANIGSKAKVDDAATQTATREVAAEVTQPDFSPLTMAVEQFTAAAKQMSKPRKRTLIRGEDGRATGTIEE